MTATLLIPLVVAIVGLALYFVATNPKVQQVGLWSFVAAMVALMFYYIGHAVHIG